MNCDWIAPFYRWFEYLGFGRQLERRRFRWLREIGQARRVLVLGDGDGRFLARLVREIPHARIESIELSARMQALATRRTGCRVDHRQGDARTIALESGAYDLIATHFFLDCFNEADCAQVVERIGMAVAPRAQWLVSEFRQARKGWRAWWSRAWISSLYCFFRVATRLRTKALVDHHPLLMQQGFQLVRQESVWWGLLVSELWERVPDQRTTPASGLLAEA